MQRIEISLKEILVYILHKWLLIFLCALIVGGTMVGFYFLQNFINSKDSQDNSRVVEIEINEKIEELNELVNGIKKQLNDSLSGNIFTNMRIAKMSADVLHDSDNVDIKRIKSGYLSIFNNLTLSDLVKQLTYKNYSEDELKKFISAIFQDDNLGASRLIISAVGGDELDPVLFVNMVYNALLSKSGDVIKRVGQHSIKESEITTLTVSKGNSLYADERKRQLAIIEGYEAEIGTLRSRLEKLQPKLITEVSRLFIMGATVTLILCIVFVAFYYVYHIPVVIPDQIQNRMHIRYLGGVREKSVFGLSRLAHILSGNYLLWTDKKYAAAYIATNISEFIKPGETVMLTGSVNIDIMKELCEKLMESNQCSHYNFNISGDITMNMNTINALSNADHVILVEQLGSSSIKKVNQQIERIAMSRNILLGYVLFSR